MQARKKVWVESSKIRKYSPHTPQPTLPYKHVTLGKFCSNFEIDANDSKPDDDNADANEAIEAKADKTVKAN